MRLDEDDRFLRADAGRQPIQRHLIGVLHQILGAFDGGQRMDVDDAVNAIVLILQGHVILNRPQVIAQVLPAGWPGAGKATSSSCHG